MLGLRREGFRFCETKLGMDVIEIVSSFWNAEGYRKIVEAERKDNFHEKYRWKFLLLNPGLELILTGHCSGGMEGSS